MSTPPPAPPWSSLPFGTVHCSNPVDAVTALGRIPNVFMHSPAGHILFQPDKTVVGLAAPGVPVPWVGVLADGSLVAGGGPTVGSLTEFQVRSIPPPARPAAGAPQPEVPKLPAPSPGAPLENVAYGGLSAPGIAA